MKLKQTKSVILVATLLAYGSLAGGAIAAVVWSTGGGARNDNFFVSDVNHSISGSRWTAGEFTVTAPSVVVRSVQFRGISSSSAAQTFDIAFFNDTGGSSPSSIIGTASALLVHSKTAVSTHYVYEADLASDLSLTAGNYWVSIVDTTAGVDFSFNGSNASVGLQTASSITDHETGYFFVDNRRINVIGNDTRYSPIPEPSSALLLGLSSLALVFRRTRR